MFKVLYGSMNFLQADKILLKAFFSKPKQVMVNRDLQKIQMQH